MIHTTRAVVHHSNQPHQSSVSSSQVPDREILILPDILPSDTKTIVVNGVEITVKMGDIFDQQNATHGGNCSVVIPGIFGSVLYSRLMDLNGFPHQMQITHESPHLGLIRSRIPGIKRFIIYEYDWRKYRLEDDLIRMARMSEPGDTLILPTLGVNNGVDYSKVADRLFYGIIDGLSMPDSSLGQLSQVVITTLFDPDQDHSSTRVIKHLFNLMNIYIYQNQLNQPECIICQTMKQNIIFGCGHRIICQHCLQDFLAQNNHLCPICRAPIRQTYPCYLVYDHSEQVCSYCHQSPLTHAKSGEIFLPCGHYNVACRGCSPSVPSSCPVCSQTIIIKLKLY